MNIYVSNLGFQVENEDLKNLFTSFGEVTSAKVITDRETNAIKQLNGAMVEGRALSVTIARPKDNSGGGKAGFKKNNFWK